MKFLLAAAVTTMLVAASGDGLDGHGNNPDPWVVDVNIAGVELAVPLNVVILLELLGGDYSTPATDCADDAIRLCGEGRICCFRISGTNGDYDCSFSCQDIDGHCQPCPTEEI